MGRMFGKLRGVQSEDVCGMWSESVCGVILGVE